ncbi:hypothetical protein JCM1840_002222 [Sporobolomyces johnsonii]
MSTNSYSDIYPSPDPDKPASLFSTDSPSSDFLPAPSTFAQGRLSTWVPAAQTMDNFDADDFTGASPGESSSDGGVGMSSSGASDVAGTPDQWGLLLSFDDVAVPPLSAPASFSDFQQHFQRREPSAPAASPLSSSFAPSPGRSASASASSLSPPFSTSSMMSPTSCCASSGHSPPAFVHVFRLPSPATPSCPLSRSSTVSPILPLTSTSLDIAVSVLNSPSTLTRESVSPAPTPVDPPTLYVSLESAAARLKLPPSPSRNNSDTARQRAAPTVGSDLVSSRPKRSKSFKAETLHLFSSTTSEAGEVESQAKASDVSKLIAAMWRQESAEVRAEYAQRASIEAEAHAEKYPGYCYRPKRRGAGAEGDSPRRKVTRDRTAEGRKRARTTSAVDFAVSDWAFSPVPNDPRQVDPSSVLLPSPSISETPMIAPYDFDSGAFLASLDGCPVTPSTCSSSSFDFGTSTLPPSPASVASDAWTVFQSASPTTFDSSVPANSSSFPAYDTFPIPPYSAPASLASFDFDFNVPSPVFESEPPAISVPPTPSLSSHQCPPPSLESYTFPPAPAPVHTTPLSTYGENLRATLPPTDDTLISPESSGTFSIPR